VIGYIARKLFFHDAKSFHFIPKNTLGKPLLWTSALHCGSYSSFVKEKCKQNKRIRSVRFLSTENLPEWSSAIINQFIRNDARFGFELFLFSNFFYITANGVIWWWISSWKLSKFAIDTVCLLKNLYHKTPLLELHAYTLFFLLEHGL